MPAVLSEPLETASHAACPADPPRVHLFGIEIDVVRMQEAVGVLLDWIASNDGLCRYVVTPNVDHTVLLQEHAALRRAYAEASLVLADGAPIVLASRLLGKPLPERVAGSDLAPQMFDATATHGPLKIFLLGGMPGIADRAARNITERWPLVEVVGTASPPVGFERDPAQSDQLLAAVAAAKPDVLLVGLGAPKQELWVCENRDSIAASVALCIGATIDFLAGERRRAPLWMRRIGLEWLYRAAGEPRRLGRRYLRDAWIFPRLVYREWLEASSEHPPTDARD